MEGLFDNFVPSELVAKLFQLCDCSSSSIIKVNRSGKRGWQVKLNFLEKCDGEGPVDRIPENTIIKYRRVSQFHRKRDLNRFIELKDTKRKDARLTDCSEPEFIARDFVEDELVTPTVPLRKEIPRSRVSEQALLRNEHVQKTSPNPGGDADGNSLEVCSLDVLPKSKVPPDDISPNRAPNFDCGDSWLNQPAWLDQKLLESKYFSDCNPEPEPPDSTENKYIGLSNLEMITLTDEEWAEMCEMTFKRK